MMYLVKSPAFVVQSNGGEQRAAKLFYSLNAMKGESSKSQSITNLGENVLS